MKDFLILYTFEGVLWWCSLASFLSPLSRGARAGLGILFYWMEIILLVLYLYYQMNSVDGVFTYGFFLGSGNDEQKWYFI